MRIVDRVRGNVRVEIRGVFPEKILNACAMQAVALWDLESLDSYTFRATAEERQLAELTAIAGQAMCDLKVLRRQGGGSTLRFFRRRLLLLAAAALILGLLLFSSLFIWEIRVQGCERLSQGQVLRALADCGVEQGTYWPGLSMDLLRSRMLTEMPELAWMTVNISGSRATVLIMERQEKPEIYTENASADLIAGKTGIITRLSVLNGRALVQPGQTVLEGDTLVTGTLESLSNPPRQIRAQGRVMADTWYELTAVCPLDVGQKGEIKSRRSRFALKIGKRRINFYGHSKMTLDGYDTIVHEYNMGIEGLFALPISLLREERIRYRGSSETSEPEQEMGAALRSALQERIDGEIVSSQISVDRGEGLVYVTLFAQCNENIAVPIETQGASAPP